MILNYGECISRYGSDYKIKKEISEGRLFRKEKGVYSDEKLCSDIALVTAKYPRAVFAGESAYYYYGLTDVIPEHFHLATRRTDSRIKDGSVRQYYVNEELFELGRTNMNYHGIIISIYNRERLLIDLIRQKNKLPYDYYKEIIISYRRIAEELDFFLVEEYTAKLKRRNSIVKAIELEVL